MKKNTKQLIGTIILIAQILSTIVSLQSSNAQNNTTKKGQDIINTAIVSQTYLLNASLNIQANIFSGVNSILTNITSNETLKEEINKAYYNVINETQNRINTSNQVLQEERKMISEWYSLDKSASDQGYYAILANLVVILIIVITFFILPDDDSICIYKEKKRK